MATDTLDFAALESAVETPTTEEPVVEEPVVEEPATEEEPVVEGEPATDEPTTEEPTTEESTSGTPGEKKTVTAPEKITSESVSKYLKGLKDSDPKSAAVTRTLRDAYFSHDAYKKEFSTVQEARNAKAFIEAIGGEQGWESAQSEINNIHETDALVHAGDSRVWDNVVEDLRSENHLDSLPKLVTSGLSKLKEVNPDAYWEAFSPALYEGLVEIKLPQTVDYLDRAFAALESELKTAQFAEGSQFKGQSKALEGLKATIADMKRFMTDESSKDEKRKDTRVSPEMEKLNREREAFNKQVQERDVKERNDFKNSVATELEKTNNTTLGAALAPYLKMAFFKDFPLPTKQDLGRGIKAHLYNTLENDKAYQIQMKNYWSAKSPDRAKIAEYHKTKMDAIAKDIVKTVIEQRYPNYAKGGSAAGKIAAQKTKTAAATKASTQSVQSGKPIYVAAKPKDLIRDEITVGGKELSKSDLQMLEITGKGYVKGTNGVVRFITWRK